MSLIDTPGFDALEGNGDGRIFGVARGLVTDNRDPDGLGRVRVQLTCQAEGSAYWARTAAPMSGSGYGTWFLPEVGDEVLVGAENGDPALLYVLGMLWNGKAKPPAANGDGKNPVRLIKSRAGHQLLFDDTEAAPVVELKLADGKRVTLDKDGVAIDDAAGNTILIKSTASEIAITSAAKLTLKSAQVAIEADGTLEIKSGGTLTIKGALVQIN
ncbi:MAG: phage tail protein [Alphaproteobacteria bacterium]|nr:phage tail protein [Alphaproteobacteria bacterium]MDB5719938.1 phage tail protein [Alphaproteobacteria bacterium]